MAAELHLSAACYWQTAPAPPGSSAMTEFLEVVSSDQLRCRLDSFRRLSSELISIDDAIGRFDISPKISSPRKICPNIPGPLWTGTL